MLQKSLSLSAMGLTLAMVTGSTIPVGAFDQLVVLGDSTSDQGNFLPLTGGMFPNSPYFSEGRFSNGEVWTGYLAQELGLGSSIINYAFGGATTGKATASPIPGAIGLEQQIDAFKQRKNVLGQPITLANDPLYTLWAGPNDYLLILGIALDPSQEQGIVNQTIANLASALQVLVDAGAHDIVVPNLPDISLTPLVVGLKSQSTTENLKGLVKLHNQGLDQILKNFSQSYPNINFIGFNSYDFLNQALDNHKALGFSNTREACTTTNLYDPINPLPIPPSPLYNAHCSDQLEVQNTFFYWDSVHQTTRVHKLIASSVVALLNSDQKVSVPEPTSPFSLLALGAGSVALVTLKRRRH